MPFLYAANGEIIHHLDVRDNPRISRKISNFHTPDAMAEPFHRDKFSTLTWLANTPNNISRLYPFQRDAISETESAILKGKREMLLAMATGTGKTFTTVSQVYRLLESKLAQRVLFLVDRRALAAQAVRAFASFTTPKGNKFNQEYEVYHQKFRREDLKDEKDFDPNVLPENFSLHPTSRIPLSISQPYNGIPSIYSDGKTLLRKETAIRNMKPKLERSTFPFMLSTSSLRMNAIAAIRLRKPARGARS